MNLTDDIVLKMQKGTPILLDDICAFYPSTVGEIVDEGYSVVQQYLSVLTLTHDDLNNENIDKEARKYLNDLSDFECFLVLTSVEPELNNLAKRGFYFFTHEEVNFSFSPAQIVIGPPAEKHFLNEAKFCDFRQLLQKMFFLDQDNDAIIIYENDEPFVKKLKRQMLEGRAKTKKAKQKNKKDDFSDLRFSDLVGSVAINNCGLNMENIWNITYYAFHDQLKRMGWRDQFNINNRAALAGAKLKKEQLQHWMRSIASSNKT